MRYYFEVKDVKTMEDLESDAIEAEEMEEAVAYAKSIYASASREPSNVNGIVVYIYNGETYEFLDSASSED